MRPIVVHVVFALNIAFLDDGREIFVLDHSGIRAGWALERGHPNSRLIKARVEDVNKPIHHGELGTYRNNSLTSSRKSILFSAMK